MSGRHCQVLAQDRGIDQRLPVDRRRGGGRRCPECLDADTGAGAEPCFGVERHDHGAPLSGRRDPQARSHHGGVAAVGIAELEPGHPTRPQHHQGSSWPLGSGRGGHGLSLGAKEPDLGDALDRAGPRRGVAELDGHPDGAGGAIAALHGSPQRRSTAAVGRRPLRTWAGHPGWCVSSRARLWLGAGQRLPGRGSPRWSGRR